MRTKACCRCRAEKPIEEFGKNSSRKDGLSPECRVCVKERNRAARNSSEGKAYLRAYNRSESAKQAKEKYLSKPETKAKITAHNASPEVVARKAAHAAKPESVEQRRLYSKSQRAKMVRAKRRSTPEYAAMQSAWRKSKQGAEALAKWRASPSGRASARQAKRLRRAREKGAEGAHTKEDVYSIFMLQKGRCACCKVKLNKSYHVDHVFPLSKGGSNDKHNLQILCQTCNNQKHARHPIEFMQMKGFLL